MKRIRVLLFCVLLAVGMTAATCKPTQQRTAYNTVYTAEQAATSAYSAYLDLVIKHQIQTNGVPTVSAKFNLFQRAADMAATSIAFNPTNPAPADVQALLNDLLVTIDLIKKGALK